ncbi:radical SAM protein [Clostridiaceae bacterium M8S5]|nr:radical SAM protein [Clostridiaceae bacterium M8S5]
MKLTLNEQNLSKVFIIFPPHWCPSHPYLSLPCIQSYLKAEGINTGVIDLNIELFNHFISADFLKNLLNNYRDKFNENEIFLLNEVIENIEASKTELNDSKTFINGRKYAKNKRMIDFAYRSISLAGEFNIDRNRLRYFDNVNIDNINKVMDKIEKDLIYKAYKRLIDLEALGATKLIGISIISEDQLIPALLLCRYLKFKLENVHIFIGGSYLSKLIRDVSIIKPIFNYCDSIIVDEGEKAVVELTKHVLYGKEIKSKNIIFESNYNKNNNVDFIPNYCDIEELPIPNFEGLLNEKYLAPVRILPYYVSRKCYWNKCTFCQHDEGYSNRVKVKSIGKIRDELIKYNTDYKVDVIHFIDSALHPNTLRNICKIIREENLKIKWFCYIRAEKNFSYELLKEMKLCGCIYVNVGIESFSNSVLKSMNKGIEISDINNIILNTDKAGIWAHLFLINNFPTETLKDKYESVLYLNSMSEHIHSISIGKFLLMRNTEVIKNPKKFNISKIYENNSYSSFYEYEKSDGDNNDDTEQVTSLFYKLVPTSKLFNEKLAYRDHLPALLSLEELVLEKHRIVNFIDEVDESCIKYLMSEYIELVKNNTDVIIFIPKTCKTFKIPMCFINILSEFGNKRISRFQFFNKCYNHKVEKNVAEKFWMFITRNAILSK